MEKKRITHLIQASSDEQEKIYDQKPDKNRVERGNVNRKVIKIKACYRTQVLMLHI